jgi:hypothetical protein
MRAARPKRCGAAWLSGFSIIYVLSKIRQIGRLDAQAFRKG